MSQIRLRPGTRNLPLPDGWPPDLEGVPAGDECDARATALSWVSKREATLRAHDGLGGKLDAGGAAAPPLCEHDYSCPICLEPLLRPVVLSCNHRFCRGCWLRVLQGRDVRATAHLTGSVACPLGRCEVPPVVPEVDEALAKEVESLFNLGCTESRASALTAPWAAAEVPPVVPEVDEALAKEVESLFGEQSARVSTYTLPEEELAVTVANEWAAAGCNLDPSQEIAVISRQQHLPHASRSRTASTEKKLRSVVTMLSAGCCGCVCTLMGILILCLVAIEDAAGVRNGRYTLPAMHVLLVMAAALFLLNTLLSCISAGLVLRIRCLLRADVHRRVSAQMAEADVRISPPARVSTYTLPEEELAVTVANEWAAAGCNLDALDGEGEATAVEEAPPTDNRIWRDIRRWRALRMLRAVLRMLVMTSMILLLIVGMLLGAIGLEDGSSEDAVHSSTTRQTQQALHALTGLSLAFGAFIVALIVTSVILA
eukprot:CAMPEP_0119099050 /NCGR_PEP_ID=MMETSP1178-20130426/184891_1 /TAXON_ID=33656 /ORGANISM="unid sp, Strain CCMP2000" /LENGTH=484 /DNA_ID=CAMNT_0007083029 /DNA_START=34 /DNA_END=1484 /DNA_ORIENTATION=+